ncbi:hypothetical protein P3T73_09615 [Kiritimatiellota bacterium B12222]|nr:hypothetical protein P3T73_09615 [Kiritimatiellota bacterium B12222]
MSMETQLSERQFFLLSLAGVSALILILFFGVLRPKLVERTQLREEVASKTQLLQSSGYLLGEGPLLKRKQEIESQVTLWLNEWKVVTEHLSSFANQAEWQSQDVATIDYKTYLYDIRRSLSEKAEQQNISVPTYMGMTDLLESNDVAREKMLQLLAVEKLVDTSIEYGIADIRSIVPLTPIAHTIGNTDVVYMEEYPLRVIFEGPMSGLFRLWEAMFQKEKAMLLRNIAMEKTSLKNADEVRMTATLSSFLFMEEAEKLNPQQGKAIVKTKARGH